MKKYNIPYKWYKISLMVMWICALICITGTWVTWKTEKGYIWGLICNIILILTMAAIVAVSFLHVRLDLRKRGIWLAVMLGLQVLFFFLVLGLAVSNTLKGNESIADNAIPTVHTLILLGIAAFGIYFTQRARLTFKTSADGTQVRNAQDSASAFGPAQPEQPKPEPVQPEEPKAPRDEKTGIVSL